MKPRAALAVVLAALSIAGAQNDRFRAQEFMKMLVEKPWIKHPQDNWDLPSQVNLEPDNGLDNKVIEETGDTRDLYDDDLNRTDGEKRSAVATALNYGRRRRQPTPALGKAVTPYVGVGVLNDVGSFFDTLRDNLETLASLSPEQRSSLFQDPPQVLKAPSPGTSSGGVGMRRLHALRPLRPTGYIRSFVEPDRGYPGANHHDPQLLWTGLGRR